MRGLLVLLGLLGLSVLGAGSDARTHNITGTPVTGTPVSSLAGDALPLLLPGEAGMVDVIAVGVPDEWNVPIVLRNNTDETLILTTIHGTAHDAAGALIGEGEPGAFMSPTVISPGQVAIAAVYFNSREYLPLDAVLTFEVETEPVTVAAGFRQDLEIVDAVHEADGIVGLARNGTNESLVGKVNVLSVCFDATGTMTEFSIGYADALDLDPGETVPVRVSVADPESCEAFLVGANGYRKP